MPFHLSSNVNFYANHKKTSQIDVDYDSDIIGYDNVVVNNFQIRFSAHIVDNNTNDIIYESYLIGNKKIDKTSFTDYIFDVYSKYQLLSNINIDLYCEHKNMNTLCFM